MRVSKTFIYVAFTSGLLAWLPLPIATHAAEPPIAAPTHFHPADQRFATQARNLALRNGSFDDIFAALCRTALTNAAANPKLNLQDEARSIWGGLWLWTCKDTEPLPLFHAGGLPTLHPQPDGSVEHGYDVITLEKHYAQHFIAGGMFEAYFDSGRWAGVRKERLNSVTGDYFDFNKVAVTSMGARWVDIAVQGNAAHTRRWLELWASRQYTLSKSMPKLHWRTLPPFVDAKPDEIKAVEDEVDAAITFPADTPTNSPAKPH
ncbi:MAG TPA: hypothetical protein VMP11_15750 [Verrucomicrobiae bacterium]|nr:hypothetical protein [Verrucomicrobiae bacterium]